MTIAELFVNLGVKGADSAGKALSGVKSGLGDVKSMSLEAKAAIVAVVYGLERMMSQSAQMGTSLLNFNTLTGISAQSLQQWQYAARQAGVSGEELTGSLKAVQNSMTNMLLGKGAPEGMAMLANKVGFDPAKARDTLYVMGQLQKFAQTVPQDVGNNMLKSFGVSEGTIAAMRRNMFTEDNFKKAPTYSDKEVGQLNKVDVAWSNLGNKIQMAMGHFTSKHGMELVTDLSKITTEVFKMLDAFTKLAEKLKFFQGIAKVFEGWGLIFKGITGGVENVTDALSDDPKKANKGKEGIKDFFGGMADAWKGMQIDAEERQQAQMAADMKAYNERHGAPAMKPSVAGSGKTQNISVTQTLQFQHDGKDAKKTGASVNKAVKDAYRQMQAQGQGS